MARSARRGARRDGRRRGVRGVHVDLVGLLVSIAGTLSYDVWPRLRHAHAAGRHGARGPKGIVLGGSLATTAIALGLARGVGSGATGALLAQPAAVTVPVAFTAMIAVSLLRPGPAQATDRHALALHAPEELGFDVGVRAPVGAAAAGQ